MTAGSKTTPQRFAPKQKAHYQRSAPEQNGSAPLKAAGEVSPTPKTACRSAEPFRSKAKPLPAVALCLSLAFASSQKRLGQRPLWPPPLIINTQIRNLRFYNTHQKSKITPNFIRNPRFQSSDQNLSAYSRYRACSSALRLLLYTRMTA